jgi:hypothetical protein
MNDMMRTVTDTEEKTADWARAIVECAASVARRKTEIEDPEITGAETMKVGPKMSIGEATNSSTRLRRGTESCERREMPDAFAIVGRRATLARQAARPCQEVSSYNA